MLSKKCFLVGIITLLCASLAIADPPAVHPTTGEPLVIDCLRGTPDAIDGDLSDWNLEAMTPAVLDVVEQLHSGQDTWANPEDCSGEFYLLWDDENIYIAVVVKDDGLSMNKTGGDIWNADCVEIFFSTTNAVAGHAEHYQYGFNANNQRWNWCNMDGAGGVEPDYLQIASSVTADGYICEASIAYGQMPSLDFTAGNTIGFHPVFDDTDNGDRELQMTWTGREAHDQSLGFGHMVLSADSPAVVDMEIGYAIQPPVLDGEYDGIWAAASTQSFVPLEDPANASGTWRVLYDADNLYVLVDITDDVLQNDSASSWQDDSVEIYFDGGNTKVSTPLSGDDHQYTFGWTTDDIQGTNITGYTEGIEHAQVTTDTGWRIEVKMPWMSIWGVVPQAGDLIGIDCYYNDDDDGGDSRENKLLSFSAIEGWNDASQWGTAVLAAGPLKLDVGNSHNADELEEGFTSFTLDDSGSQVNGITIEFAGINSGDSRRRGEPSGVPYENIYRDFIFGRQSEPGVGYVSVTLSGLQANQTYLITLYSWDTNSTNIRIADWTANGEFLFSTIHDGNVNPPVAEDDYAYTGAATADANGVILMEAVPGEGTFAAEPFAFINALVLSMPVVPVDPGSEGLVAYYALENDANDSSGNGLHGTIVGNPTYVQGPAGYGTAMEFHGLLGVYGGGDYIDCGNDASLDIPGPISLALWIKPGADDPEGQGTETAPMAKAMSGVGWSWQVRYGWGSDQPYMAFTFNTSPRAWAYVGRNLERDEWCHIACSADGTTLKCYLNGEQTDSTPMGQITSSEAPVLIGSDGWGCDWIGAIDEVAIYNRDLSASEIRYLAAVKTEPVNLLQNPSFEDDEPVLDDPDWVNWCTWNPAEGAGSNATIVDNEAADGARSLRIEPKGDTNWYFIVLYLSFPAELDKNYTTTFWAKAEAPRPLTVQMKAADNSINAWGATDFELTTEWAEYSYTSEVLIDDVKLEILCSGSEVPFWLDLVSVSEAD